MKPVRQVIHREEVEFFLRLHGLWEGIIQLPRPPPPPFDIDTMEPIEPPWQAIKEWIAAAPLWPCGQQDPPPDLVSTMCRKNAAKAFPTTSRTSTGSTVPGIHQIPIQKATTKVKHGRHPKSSWTTAASWFSNTPEDPDRLAEKPPPKEFLAKRLGDLPSQLMKTAVKSSESAVYRGGLGIFLTETPSTDAPTCPPKPRRRRKHLFRPLFPRNPHFPARWSDPMALSAASRTKQFPSKDTIQSFKSGGQGNLMARGQGSVKLTVERHWTVPAK
jgi:hypothetical protein